LIPDDLCSGGPTPSVLSDISPQGGDCAARSFAHFAKFTIGQKPKRAISPLRGRCPTGQRGSVPPEQRSSGIDASRAQP
jgi:hypothetical protein